MEIAKFCRILIIVNILVKSGTSPSPVLICLPNARFLNVLKVEFTEFETFCSELTFSAKSVIPSRNQYFSENVTFGSKMRFPGF